MQLVSLHDKTNGAVYTHVDSAIEMNLEKGKLWRITCNGKVLTKSSKFNVSYACESCQRHNMVTLCLFYKRLAKNRTTCDTCEEQRALQMMPNKKAEEIIQVSQEMYKNMDDDFKDAYEANYLMNEDFERIKPNIVSFQHEKFPCNDDIMYVPILIVNSSAKFYPGLYHKPTDTIQKCMYIVFKCQECDDQFTSKTIEVHKNHHRILCKHCSDCSKLLHTLKTYTVKNIQNEQITYKSKYDLKLITFCEENKLLVRNGPTVPYEWLGQQKSYQAGFILPDINFLVIVIAHNTDPITTKDQEKHKAAIAYCAENNLKYRLVYPKVYMHLINELKKAKVIKI